MAKNLPVGAGDARDADSVPGSGRSLGVGNDNPHQYSCLYRPWGHKESDMTEATEHACILLMETYFSPDNLFD